MAPSLSARWGSVSSHFPSPSSASSNKNSRNETIPTSKTGRKSPHSSPPLSPPLPSSPPLILTESRLRRAVQEWKESLSPSSSSPCPPEFLCPLSLEIMVFPVTIASGHTYEQSFISRWFREGHGTCPTSNLPLANRELRPHVTMRCIITEWCETYRKVLPDGEEASCEASLGKNSAAEEASWKSLGKSLKEALAKEVSGKGSDSEKKSMPRTFSNLSFCQEDVAAPKVEIRKRMMTSAMERTRSMTPSATDRSSMMMSAVGRSSTMTRMVTSPQREGEREPGRENPLTRGFSFQDVRMRARSMEELKQMMSRSQSERRASSTERGAGQGGGEGVEEERNGGGADVRGSGGKERREGERGISGRSSSFSVGEEERKEAEDGDILKCVGVVRGECDSEISRSVSLNSLSFSDFDDDTDATPVAVAISVEEAQEATLSLWKMTKISKATRKRMIELGVVQAVTPLLVLKDPLIQENSITIILNLALESEGKATVLQIRALDSILKVMHHGLSHKAQENATAVISSLSVTTNGRVAVREAGVIPSLVDFLASGPSPRSQRDSAIGLFNLALDSLSAMEMIEAGCVLRILDMMEEGTGVMCEVEECVLELLQNLAKIPEAQYQLGRLEGVAMLVGVLEAGSVRAKESATACLLTLARGSDTCREAIRGEGGICPLLPLSQHGSPRGREKATSLLNLLRSC